MRFKSLFTFQPASNRKHLSHVLKYIVWIEFFSARICDDDSSYSLQDSCDKAVTDSTASCDDMTIRMDDLVDEGRPDPFKTYKIVICEVNDIIHNCVIAGKEPNLIIILNYSQRYKCHES